MRLNHLSLGVRSFALVCVLGVIAIPVLADREVAVEALGYATLEDGETLQEVHRKALKDASVNAVVQAKVSVDVNVKVDGMQLSEKGVRTRGTGFIDELVVQEAGLIPYTDPPVYRVRVRAMVKPLPTFPPTAERYFEVDRNAWQPVIALTVESDTSPERREGYIAAISRALRTSGIEVLHGPQQEPALSTTVVIGFGEQDDEKWMTVNWEMSLGEPVDPMDRWGNPSVRGNWLLEDGASPSGEWWQRLGVMMAQDSMRLWNAPRPVRITFEGMNDDQLTRLGAAMGRQGEISIERAHEEPSIHMVTMPIAGNSQDGVNTLLRQANLLEDLERVHATMSEIRYRQGH